MTHVRLFWGISLVNDTQANQSALAARITSAPTHRLKIIVSYSLAAFIMHFSGCLINFFYLNYILGVDFGGNIPLIILDFCRNAVRIAFSIAFFPDKSQR